MQQFTSIANQIQQSGGQLYYIGGCVRDKILGLDCKDIDIEVFGMNYQSLVFIFESNNIECDLVGKEFGILKVVLDNQEYDFSIPRKENRVGINHTDFECVFDSNITIEDAAKRRDFTINSISLDLNGNIVDSFGGINDLDNKILRPTSESFLEDVLRVLRAFQFASRFNLVASDELIIYSLLLKNEYKNISQERIWEEWKKFFLKGKYFHAAFDFLSKSQWIDFYPEIRAIENMPQDKIYHPEGKVLKHTAYVMEYMSQLCDSKNITGDDKLVLMIAALCHDFGKANYTQYDNGRIRSKGHEKNGDKPTISFLERIGCPKKYIDLVVPLVQNHMIIDKLSDKAIRRLSNRLMPANINQLVLLCESDRSGRPPFPTGKSEAIIHLETRSKELGCDNGKPKPLVTGKHLIDFGYKPGPQMGKIINRLYQMQLNGSFSDTLTGISRVKSFINDPNL